MKSCNEMNMSIEFKKFYNKILLDMKTFEVTIDHILVYFIGSKLGLYVSFLIRLQVQFVRHYVRELASDEPLCRPFLPMQCTVGDNCLNFLLLRPKHFGSFAQNSFQINLSIGNICNFGSRLLEMPLFYKMPLKLIAQWEIIALFFSY